MKLRIHGDSIRLRLSRSEVVAFAADGDLEQCCDYGGGAEDRLVYGIEASPEAATVEVRAAANRIKIVLPRLVANDWTGTDRIEVSASVPTAQGKQLKVLVEKEFRRLHGASKDPDLYPNPLEGKT